METSKGASGKGEARGLSLTTGRWVRAQGREGSGECVKREREETHRRQNKGLFGGAGCRGERWSLWALWGKDRLR